MTAKVKVHSRGRLCHTVDLTAKLSGEVGCVAAAFGPLLESFEDFTHFVVNGGLDEIGVALAARDTAYIRAVDANFFGDSLLNPTHKTEDAFLLWVGHGEDQFQLRIFLGMIVSQK